MTYWPSTRWLSVQGARSHPSDISEALRRRSLRLRSKLDAEVWAEMVDRATRGR
jgi:hypothetical protein